MGERPQRGIGTYKQYPQWAKGPARVKDGYIVLDENRATPYYIHDSPDLVFDLLDVYKPNRLDDRDVVRFVRRYGLLYHGSEALGSGECRESLDKWHDELASLNVVARLYLDLLESRRSGLTRTMREVLSIAASPEHPKPRDDELFEAVSVVLGELVTEGMRDTKAGLVSTCALGVNPKGPTTFLLTHLPTNLISAAYGHFAFLTANKTPISTCPGCGRLFIKESGRQKYHSKSCANTSRWRRWKEHQAAD